MCARGRRFPASATRPRSAPATARRRSAGGGRGLRRTLALELGGQERLGGKGGEGIFRLAAGDPNLGSILEQITAYETDWAMAQRFLPEIREGDKRILLLAGARAPGMCRGV